MMITRNNYIKIFPFFRVILIYLLFYFNASSSAQNINENFISVGINDAPVKIKVFSSLTCPHCANFHNKVVPKLKNYIDSGKVQIIFIDFPLDKAAFNASKLLHCLDKRKQISFLDKIYEDQEKVQAYWKNNYVPKWSTPPGYFSHYSGFGSKCKVEFISKSDLLRARGYAPE